MMVLLSYFLVAAMAGVAASAMVGLVLTNVLIGRFEKADRQRKWRWAVRSTMTPLSARVQDEKVH